MERAFWGHLVCSLATIVACGRSDVRGFAPPHERPAPGTGGSGGRSPTAVGGAGRTGSGGLGPTGRGGQGGGGTSMGPGGSGGLPGMPLAGEAGSGGVAGSGVAGSGVAGSGVAGSGVAGSGVAGAGACGNGRLEGDETCDDGNDEDTDGCTEMCRVARCLVPVTHATVQAAVDDRTCAAVWLTPGRDYDENITIARDLVLSGYDRETTFLDGGKKDVVVRIVEGTVEIRHLSIIHGASDSLAAGIANTGLQPLILRHAAVRDNTSSEDFVTGAGIYSTGDVVLQGTSVVANVARAVTGAAERQAHGAGIFISGALLTIDDASVISDNRAEVSYEISDPMVPGSARGGGIYVRNGRAAVRDSVVSSNWVGTESSSDARVEAEGGGIYLEDASLELGNATVSSNIATIASSDGLVGGGALAAAGATTIEIVGTMMEANRLMSNVDKGSAAGGAIRVLATDASIFVEKSTLASNGTNGFQHSTDPAVGGAIALASRGPGAQGFVMIANSRVVGNFLDANVAQGGGIFVESAHGDSALTALLVDSAAVANSAAGAAVLGGFAALKASAPGAYAALFVTNSTIAFNEISPNTTMVPTAPIGGSAVGAHATHPDGFTTVELSSATIAFNRSYANGSTLFLEGGIPSGLNFRLRNTILGENEDMDGRECVIPANAMTSEGYNLYLRANGCEPQGATSLDLDVADAALDFVLQDPFTEVAALRSTSVAVDAGNPAGCRDAFDQLLLFDQRGVARTDRCDIGAYEVQK